MTPSKDDTGFDAFFRAVTASPEFRKAVTKDWKGDAKNTLETSLQEMEKGVAKANAAMTKLSASFVTPEAVSVGESMKSPHSKAPPEGGGASVKSIGEAKTKGEDTKNIIHIEHFEMKNPETFGFKGIAGMDDLKKDLQESFIAPLRFKFMIEKLAKEQDNSPLPLGEGLGVSAADSKKREIYQRLHAEYEKFKVSIPTGLLFYGPPGTGKTFITKKLAEELHAGFIEKSVGEFGSSYMHETTKNIRAFFTAAKEASEKEPTILFLDEIDSLLSSRTNNIDANKAEEVSQFLQEFNNLSTAKNLIVIAATNRPDHLDSAIMRSGRLDKKFYIAPPDFTARAAMFELYIAKIGRPHAKLDYDELARLTEGYVSSDIETICDEVARDASQSILSLAASIDGADADFDAIEKGLAKNKITMKSLGKAISETTSSLKMVDMSIYTKWLEKVE